MSSVKVYQSQYMEVKKLYIKKNDGYIINIACSERGSSRVYPTHVEIEGPQISSTPLSNQTLLDCSVDEIQVKDLALYTHWPQHTKEFWDLLNET